MTRLLVIACCLLVASTVTGQPKKKQAVKEKPPTQKEMEAMMKEMQAEMDGMSDEDKKMLDSMGVKMPSLKAIPKLTDKQMADAWKNESRVVPERNEIGIASIPKAITDAKMGAYIAAVQNKIGSALKPAVVSMGNKVYDYIKSTSKRAADAGNMAMGLWLAGQPELALYVLGKLCATDATNNDNLSNYAAMLSMMGAQHLAIPILNNLYARYPKNSTVLNNLGQAWFGLGEIGKAEQYLDSAIRIYAYHPQANLTKSLIEESRNNKKGAIDAARRSITAGYTSEKEERLNKLGLKLKTNDLSWDRPMPQDALGLEKFKWPEYPMNVAESEVREVEWNAFKKKCGEAINELKMQQKKIEKEAEAANAVMAKQLIQAGQKGIMIDPLPRLAHKAMVKLNYLVDDKDGHIAFAYRQKTEAVASANLEAAKFEDQLNSQLKILEEKYEDKFGEGKPNPFEAACKDDTKVKDRFLSSSNKLLREAFNDFFGFMRRKINDEMYYYQYTMSPENFELAKLQAKIGWLTLITSQNPRFRDKSAWCLEQTEEEEKSYKLSNFDDIACQYNDTLDFTIIAFYNNCSRMTSKFNAKFIEYTRYDDFERAEGDTYTGSTIKVSAEKGFDELKLDKGPLKLEVKVGASIELEMDRSGVKDVTLSAEAKMGAGHNVYDKGLEERGSIAGKDVVDTTIEVGVEGRVSLISGHGKISGTGKLENIKITEW